MREGSRNDPVFLHWRVKVFTSKTRCLLLMKGRPANHKDLLHYGFDAHPEIVTMLPELIATGIHRCSGKYRKC